MQRLFSLLDAGNGFAILKSSVVAVLDTSDDNPTAARHLATVILRDSALTAQLMRHANAGGRAGQNVATVDKALALIGIDNVKAMAAALVAVDHDNPLLNGVQSEQCQAEAVAALFCGRFAAEITRIYAPRLKMQESHVCGALQNIGRLFGIYYLYDDIVASHVLQAERNLNEDEAVEAQLGMRYDKRRENREDGTSAV